MGRYPEDLEGWAAYAKRQRERQEQACRDVGYAAYEMVRLGASYRQVEGVTGVSKSQLQRKIPRQLHLEALPLSR